MIQIRQNTFETNSSSSHSLVITSAIKPHLTVEQCVNALCWDYDEETGIWSPDFEPSKYNFNRYPFKVLRRFDDKLMFLYANAPYRYYGKTKRGWSKHYQEYYKISNIVKKIIPTYNGVVFDGKHRPSCEAYDVLKTFKENNIDFVEYLTNPNIIVICDGDEYQVWKDMKKLGVIATDNIKEIKFPGG